MSEFAQMDYAELQQHCGPLFAPAGGTRPAVCLLENNGARAVLKDYNVCVGWYAFLLSPLFVWREVKALRRLEGLPGVPRLIAQVGRRAFIMEYVPAARLARKQRNAWPAPNFARLEALIQAMHEQGVAHGDLRRSSNILFDEHGQPYLVDFVSHIERGAGWNVIWNWMFHHLCRADRQAIAKLKLRVAPELLSEQEREQVQHSSWFDRGARGLGRAIRWLGRLLFARGEAK